MYITDTNAYSAIGAREMLALPPYDSCDTPPQVILTYELTEEDYALPPNNPSGIVQWKYFKKPEYLKDVYRFGGGKEWVFTKAGQIPSNISETH